MPIGKVLKKLRKEKGLTQGELAKSIGLAKISIANYETDKREPNSVAMAKLEDYFKVSASYLLGETDDNEYTEITEEYIGELGSFLLNTQQLSSWMAKLPKEEQIESITCIRSVINMLVNSKVPEEKQYFFIEELAGMLSEIDRFFSFLRDYKSKERNKPGSLEKVLKSYISGIAESIIEIVDTHDIECNITAKDLFYVTLLLIFHNKIKTLKPLSLLQCDRFFKKIKFVTLLSHDFSRFYSIFLMLFFIQ